MIEPYLVAKWIHVLGSTVLFGTGLGTAFFLWSAERSGDARTVAIAAARVVRADWIFTLGSGVAQPMSGAWLIAVVGYDPMDSWLVAAYGLYLLALGCWMPVVWLQIRIRDLAAAAASEGKPLPPLFRRYFRWWFALGWPAFLGLLVVFALMIARPKLW